MKTSKENKHGHPHQDWSSQTPAVLTLVELKICSKLFVQWWSNSSVQKIMLFRHLESKIKPWSSNEFGMQWKSINTLQYLRLIHFQGETGIANIKVGCARMQKSSAHKCKSLEHTNAVFCTPMHKCSSRFNWLLVWSETIETKINCLPKSLMFQVYIESDTWSRYYVPFMGDI